MISSILSSLRSKQISATELLEQHIQKITAMDGTIGAFLWTDFDRAREKAKVMDEKGDFSAPLAGIPMSLKDVLSVEGLPNTAGSKILEGYIPPYTCTVAKKLEEAGAILLGKVNTDEFTMGSSCENSAYKKTRNPWDTERVPGGSSGGSAASVATGMGIFSIGTDTGGSIRQPANFCGVTGLKVSYGRVSRYGIISYASSFDSIGPIANTVEDTAIILSVIAGHDPNDATTPDIPAPDYTKKLNDPIKGKTVGIIKEFLEAEGFDPDLKESFQKTIEQFRSLGCQIKELSFPLTQYAIPTYYLLVKAEASTNLARYDGIRFGKTNDSANFLHELYEKTRSEGFGPEAKRAIMMGTYTLSAGYYDAYYLKAAKVRTKIREEYLKAFEEVDVIVAPVSPFSPFRIGEKVEDPLAMYLADIFTVTANLAGICGLAVPTDFVKDLPTGVQIFGRPFAEETVLNFGKHLEESAGFLAEREKRLAELVF